MTYPNHTTIYPPVPAPAPQRKFRPLAWVAFGVGLAGCALIPIPILNNMGAILGVAGAVMSLISIWGTERWLSVAALALSGLAVVGTIAIQAQWARELDDLQRDLDRTSECIEAWDPATTTTPPDC